MVARIQSLKIEGYRPFGEFTAPLGALEVLVGANGSGKSALFEFLKFLRDSIYQEIPPEIIAGSFGQEIFHIPGPERFSWDLELDIGYTSLLRYEGQLNGPVGKTRVSFERVESITTGSDPFVYLDMVGEQGSIQFEDAIPIAIDEVANNELRDFSSKRPTQLTLGTLRSPMFLPHHDLRRYILNWRFYSSFRIANDKIRRPVPIEQEPLLHEDAGNLSAVLFYLMTEHRQAFDELQASLRAMIPGFVGLSVKARGRGEVIAFWQERGIDRELSLADVSDGILRLLCWTVLCVQPNPPTLICIDEPDQGVHPRTLPILAGLFQKASQRTQILLATHASYFISQFPLENIAVMRKENGEAVLVKPSNSQTMIDMLDTFGVEELEHFHRSDELEQFS
jgi:predicted ATPase